MPSPPWGWVGGPTHAASPRPWWPSATNERPVLDATCLTLHLSSKMLRTHLFGQLESRGGPDSLVTFAERELGVPKTRQQVGPTGPSGSYTQGWGPAASQVHARSTPLSFSGMQVWKLAAYFYNLLGNTPLTELRHGFQILESVIAEGHQNVARVWPEFLQAARSTQFCDS